VAFDNLTIVCPAWAEFVCSADYGELGHTSGRLCRRQGGVRRCGRLGRRRGGRGCRIQCRCRGSSATYGDDGSEELEDAGEPLSHSSKSPGPSSLRDWSKDDDDEPGSAATLGVTALHVAAAAVVGAQATPIVDMPDSTERHVAAPKPVATKPATPEGIRSGASAAK
jgi:hypothetical protein